MRGLLIVNTLFVHNRSLRRKHEFTSMQKKLMLSLAKFRLQLHRWSLFDGPDEKLANAIKDIVCPTSIWRELVIRRLYSTCCKIQPSAGDPISHDYDNLGWWLDLGERYGPIFGTTALQYIDRAVEQFRKNKVSLIDGIELLYRMREFTCSMFLLLDLCLEHSGEFNVRHCLSAISNYQLEEL